MNQPASTSQSAAKTYVREFLTAMVAYAIILIVSISLIKNSPPLAWWRFPLALAPLIPLCFALWAFLRFFRRMDELQRRIQLEALAFSFGATCLVTLSYGLLENVGLPILNWIWVAPFMIALWGVGSCIAAWRYQ